MRTCRERATLWIRTAVEASTSTNAAALLQSARLVPVEIASFVVMSIAAIYRDQLAVADRAKVGTTIDGYDVAVSQLAITERNTMVCSFPKAAIIHKALMTLGMAIIHHFERTYPAKECVDT